MRLIRMKSAQAMSPYAPSWDAAIGIDQWQNTKKIDTIRNFLLSKEEDILKLDVQNSAGTGLGKEDVTTRFGKYNLFDFANECPEINDLLNFLRKSWHEFITLDFTHPYPIQLTCWYNIIRKGQEIKIHRHCAGEMTYLSGNMHLDDYESKTTYEHMEMSLSLSNVKGGVTFFPGYIEHYVPIYDGDEPRVSLAFDLYIYLPPFMGIQDHLEHRKFMDNEIIQNLNG